MNYIIYLNLKNLKYLFKINNINIYVFIYYIKFLLIIIYFYIKIKSFYKEKKI